MTIFRCVCCGTDVSVFQSAPGNFIGPLRVDQARR